MSAEKVYERLWREASPSLARGAINLDPLIGSGQDRRRGLTVVLRPAAAVLDAYDEFLLEARSLEPAQYFYPRSDMHTTVLSIVSCEPEFQPSPAERAEYAQLVGTVAAGAEPFSVTYRGVSASRDGVLAQGFPRGGGLERLRSALRDAVERSGLGSTMDSRYRLETAHSTLLRFRTPLADPAAFHAFLERNRGRAFAETTVERVELVVNDWYMSAARLTEIGSFALAPRRR